MAVDLEAIRRRVSELSGNRRNSSVQLWKPEIGEHKVRGLPWPSSMVADGMPFQERWFYYIGNGPGILAPHQFGKPDPINDLIRKLYTSGKPDDRLLAKKLQPKMRTYMPVIVRGEEDKGVQVWAFGKPIYQRLLSFFTDADVGDILDPNEGYDLKVAITHTPGKMFNGKPSLDTAVDARKPSKLSADAAQAKTWLDSIPNLDDMYKLKSSQEIETLLNNWLNGGEAISPSDDEGTSKGASPSGDELDKLVNEVKSESKPAEKPKAAAKPKVKPADVEEAEEPVEKKSLDDAFAELMKDDE